MIFCMTVAEPDPDADAALEDCIARIAGGDKDALADCSNRTRPAVYGFALSIVKNAHDAEDILHDACLQVWNAAGGYRRQGKPMAWVLTITRNLAISRLREHGADGTPEFRRTGRDRLADNPAVTHEDRMMLEAVLSAPE
ncbi:MAG: RNA polymerase sigma factor [Oscillibacter sp.]